MNANADESHAPMSCPHCGRGPCERVPVRFPMVLGVVLFVGVIVVPIAVGMLPKRFISDGWIQVLLLPMIFGAAIGAIAIERYFRARFSCPQCGTLFRFQRLH